MFADRIVSEHGGRITAVIRDTDTADLDAVHALQQARKGRGVRKLNRTFLQGVAATYNANVDQAPTQTVADIYDVSRAMASKYVRMCRDLGLLDEVDNRNKGK